MAMKSQIDLYSEANEVHAKIKEKSDDYRSKFLTAAGAPKPDLSEADEKLRSEAAAEIRKLQAEHTALNDAARMAPKDEQHKKDDLLKEESNAFLRYMRTGHRQLSEAEMKEYLVSEDGLRGDIAGSFRPSPDQLLSLELIGQGVRISRGNDGSIRLDRASPARTDLPTGIHQVITETDVQRTLRYFGGVKEACAYRALETGAERNVPMLSTHSQVGRRLTAEGQGATNTDLENYSHTAVKPFTYNSDMMIFSLEYLQDAVIDVTRDVMIELPRRLGRIQNTEFTNTPTAGAANTKPEGLVTGAGTEVDFVSNTSLDWRDLENARDALDIAYLMGRETNMGLGYSPGTKGTVGWMMHQNVWSEVRKLQDSQNRPILLEEAKSGIAGLFPNTLFGYPVILNNDMPDASANTAGRTFALFGDFGMYRCSEVTNSFSVLRLYGDTYAPKNQVAFTAFHRVTGNYVGPKEAVVRLVR